MGVPNEGAFGEGASMAWGYGVTLAFEMLLREYLGDLAACDKAVRGVLHF